MPDKKVYDEFMSDIPTAEEQPVLDEETTESILEKEEEVPESAKNRRHRRLERRLQAERESNIALAAKLQTMSEVQKFTRDTKELAVDDKLLRLYGDTDQGRQAAQLTQELLDQTRESARQDAVKEWREQQRADTEEVRTQEGVLDNMVDEIEDAFDVDLTSNNSSSRALRVGFFQTLEKISPKNSEGLVTEYADPLATWEMFQLSQKPDTTRAKDLGSRSMVRSGASSDSKLEQSAAERFLKDSGII